MNISVLDFLLALLSAGLLGFILGWILQERRCNEMVLSATCGEIDVESTAAYIRKIVQRELQ